MFELSHITSFTLVEEAVKIRQLQWDPIPEWPGILKLSPRTVMRPCVDGQMFAIVRFRDYRGTSYWNISLKNYF